MPVKRTIKLDLNTDYILRCQGARRSRIPLARIKKTVEELLVAIADKQLLKPALIFDFFPVLSLDRKGAMLAPSHFISSNRLSKLYSQASEFALAVCTIGPGLEQEATRLFSKKEALRATLLDGIGSAAIDLLAQEACRLIADTGMERNYQAGTQIRPGMPGLPISEQIKIIRILEAEKIGVTVLNDELMIPRKSVSLLVGVGPHMIKRSRSEICSTCNLKESCPYRHFAEG